MRVTSIPLGPAGHVPAHPNPMPSFWQRATPWQKAAYVVGAGAALGATVWVVRWAARPRPFLQLSPQCNDFALADRKEINKAIEPLVRDAADEGAVNPFAVTTEFLGTYAPSCRSFPDAVRNPGEAKLYVSAFVEVVRVMEEQRLISPEQRAYFFEMVSVWGKSQGLSEAELPSKAPPVATAI